MGEDTDKDETQHPLPTKEDDSDSKVKKRNQNRDMILVIFLEIAFLVAIFILFQKPRPKSDQHSRHTKELDPRDSNGVPLKENRPSNVKGDEEKSVRNLSGSRKRD